LFSLLCGEIVHPSLSIKYQVRHVLHSCTDHLNKTIIIEISRVQNVRLSSQSCSDEERSAQINSESIKDVPRTAAESFKNVDEDRIKSTKRRRTSISGAAISTATAIEKPKGHEKAKRKVNVPFQRIKADEVSYHDERLMDNTFAGRNGSANDYGTRASRDLLVTRGSGFRKEKNKKKRGSYRGGEITMESHSIKFT